MGLWKDRIRGDWRYSFKYQKKVYAGGGFTTKASARSAREERRKKVKETGKEPTPMLFSQAATEYLKWSERRHAEKTFAYKKTVFRNFISHSGDTPFDKITSIMLHDYLSTRPSNHNYNVHRKELCALFSWSVKHLGLGVVSPCLHLEKLPEAQKRKSIPSHQELLKILSAANPDEKPLIIILIYTLARIDEILRLRWEDVNFEQRMVTLWTRKRKDGNWEPRYIPMNEPLYKVIGPMWNRREQQEWGFFNKKERTRYHRRPKMMRAICKRAGIAHYGFHTIRHFGATLLHDAGKISTGVIGGLLGHKSKQVTENYLHSIPESAREAMKKLGEMLAPDACM